MDSLSFKDWTPQENGVPLPGYIEYRYCPVSINHWRVGEERCPVCHSNIVVANFYPEHLRNAVPLSSYTGDPAELFSEAGYNRVKTAAVIGLYGVIEQAQKDQWFNAIQRMAQVLKDSAAALQSIINKGSWKS